MNYLKNSFTKFKKDALSKVFYDTMKYLFFTFILVFILKFIPIVKEKLEIEVSLSIWILSLIGLAIIIFSFLVANFQFRKKYKKLQSENQTDDLTGLKNHKALESDLVKLEQERNTTDEPISLILIDIDDFKSFNEKYSYEIADRILTKLGNLLNKDSRITDETYRYFMRGDEFLIVAKQTTLANAQIASERKRKLIQDTSFTIDKTEYKLTVSCGVTEFNTNEKKDLALERINKAMQTAKKIPGKNSTEIVI